MCDCCNNITTVNPLYPNGYNHYVVKEFFGYLNGIIIVTKMIPQIVKVYRTKRTEDISMFFLILGIIGTGCSITYGVLLGNEWPIITRAIATTIQILIIMVGKIIYDKQNKKEIIRHKREMESKNEVVIEMKEINKLINKSPNIVDELDLEIYKQELIKLRNELDKKNTEILKLKQESNHPDFDLCGL